MDFDTFFLGRLSLITKSIAACTFGGELVDKTYILDMNVAAS